METAEQIIKIFGMKPLPEEGGYYVETFRSKEKIAENALPNRYKDSKAFGTAILYLLTNQNFSAMHRICSDEIFHFYLGDPVTMLHLYSDGSSKVFTLGREIQKGHCVQLVVPKYTWQGCRVQRAGKFALLGTTVAPGFSLDDFELACRDELLKRYPDREELIHRLTR